MQAREDRLRRAELAADPIPAAWRYGIPAGVLGAAVVAVLPLAVDLAAGRPLWTPAALGSALFLGQALPVVDFDPTRHAALILGYTLVHGTVNVGWAAVVAFYFLTIRRQDSTPLIALGAAGVLFVALELTFLAQAYLFAPGLLEELAGGWVAVGNACAATAMGFYLARVAKPMPRRPQERES
jgi:hypothetical protein